MNIIEIIDKKRLGNLLSYSELDYSFNGYLKGNIKDYQMASLLMAICIKGMDEKEIFDLTDIFIKSGDVVDLSMFSNLTVDKHSTGGVGDKVTLIIGPIVASCGLIVPKMSGRGLGYTGGTIDKLESIPLFNTELTEKEFINQLQDIGLAITSQTGNLCPLDKIIYQLRDVTGTVESIPLIAVSIMSKKIALGANKILIDIKCGEGALIKTYEDALKLKDIMEKIGKKYNRETKCIISNMNIPLGNNIGNSLEVLEAIEILKGKKGLLTDLCLKISAEMISMVKKISFDDAYKLALDSINSNAAYLKFIEFVKYQKGNIDLLKISNNKQEVKSNKSGIVTNINALNIGKLSCSLGAGRNKKDDVINHEVGIVLNKSINEYVGIGDTLFTLYLPNQNEISINISEYYEIK